MGVGYKVEGIELHPSIAHQAMKKLTEELLCDIKAMVALGDMVKIETKVFVRSSIIIYSLLCNFMREEILRLKKSILHWGHTKHS